MKGAQNSEMYCRIQILFYGAVWCCLGLGDLALTCLAWSYIFGTGVTTCPTSNEPTPGQRNIRHCDLLALKPMVIWMFPKIGVPLNGWFMMENPIKMDDLGVPLFLETPI